MMAPVVVSVAQVGEKLRMNAPARQREMPSSATDPVFMPRFDLLGDVTFWRDCIDAVATVDDEVVGRSVRVVIMSSEKLGAAVPVLTLSKAIFILSPRLLEELSYRLSVVVLLDRHGDEVAGLFGLLTNGAGKHKKRRWKSLGCVERDLRIWRETNGDFEAWFLTAFVEHGFSTSRDVSKIQSLLLPVH